LNEKRTKPMSMISPVRSSPMIRKGSPGSTKSPLKWEGFVET